MQKSDKNVMLDLDNVRESSETSTHRKDHALGGATGTRILPRRPPVAETSGRENAGRENTGRELATRDAAARGLSYERLLPDLTKRFRPELVAVTAVMPRGRLQIVQSSAAEDSADQAFVRRYNQDEDQNDPTSWSAMRHGMTLAGVGATFERTTPAYASVAVAPLAEPLFEGYPGVLQVYRAEGAAEFSSSELKQLAVAAKQLDEEANRRRQQRLTPQITERFAGMAGIVSAGLIAIASDGGACIGADRLNLLDETLQAQVRQLAKQKSSAKAAHSPTDHTLSDSRGRRFFVRAIQQSNGAPCGDRGKSTAATLVCFTPAVTEWLLLSPEDISADSEMARLTPTLAYMSSDIQAQPGLVAVAASAKLSPFHFHRRFSELFGVTPKRIMLLAQIAQAQQMLLAGTIDLAEIAARCGFAHQSHFTSRFKQATGLTPTRWRRLARETSV